MTNDINHHFKIKTDGAPNPQAVVKGHSVRFTVLTSRLIRMEYSTNNNFEDRPSLNFWYRNQPFTDFSLVDNEQAIEIKTQYLLLSYLKNSNGFTMHSLKIKLLENGVVWHYGKGNPDNLKGTVRTLDKTDGRVYLEDGLMSKAGWSLIDDSGTIILNENGWSERRKSDGKDLYFFGYGFDYKACLKDYCKIAGGMQMFPRWALGNWWSKFLPYSDEDMKCLVGEFEDRNIPLSVCILDLEWHVVKNPYHNGWGGYTWNRDLFPEPGSFLDWMHKKGVRVGLNLHPHQGIWPHEEKYEEMAAYMDIDPSVGESVKFDIADSKYMMGYFNILLHPHEEEGVDFWWMDWQQGTGSKLPGLDPLFWLNHLHHFDRTRDNLQRSFVFSRYGGLGSHRYPIGFSGDTQSTWESLALQSYMTHTAANVGFGWWSHDIGGFTSGFNDGELYLRWVQFGVFSPILRLHSTLNPYSERRPWAYGEEILQHARQAMQLRHKLVPYIYTMMRRDYTQNLPLLMPIYYEHPRQEEAYVWLEQYYFGTELLVAPYVKPMDKDINLSRKSVWLPEGDWFDFFTGEHYTGNKVFAVYGGLGDVPAFAKAGAIIPMGQGTGINENTDKLDIIVFPGSSNTFVLYEDDGNTNSYKEGKFCETRIEQVWNGNSMTVILGPVQGEVSVIPEVRDVRLQLRGINENSVVRVLVNKKQKDVITTYGKKTQTVSIEEIRLGAGDRLEVAVEAAEADELISRRDRRLEKLENYLEKAHIEVLAKYYLKNELQNIIDDPKTIYKYVSRPRDVFLTGRPVKPLTEAQVMALAEIAGKCDLVSLI